MSFNEEGVSAQVVGSAAPHPSRKRAVMVMLIGGYASVAVTVVQGLILVPLYLHYIGDRVYGAWLGSGGVLGLLSMLELGTASLMIQRMSNAYGKRDHVLVGRYFGTGVEIQLVLVCFLMGAAVVISPYVAGWMQLAPQEAGPFAMCFVLAALAAALFILNNGVSGLAQALQRPLVTNVSAVAAGLLGLAITLVGLLTGWGLWAIPAGLLGRIIPLFLANVVYAVVLLRTQVRSSVRPDRARLMEFARLSPALFISSLGNAAVGQIETTLIAVMISPELVTVFALTRRAAEIIRMLLDQITGAVFPGFAHLYGEGNRARTADVLAQVLRLFSVTATFMFGGYLALNGAFVGLWVGREQFGGQLLTILIVLAFFFSVRNNLFLYLYAGTGEIARSTLLNTAEASIRLVLMVVLLRAVGLPGLPGAALVTGVVLAEILLRWMAQKVGLSVAEARHRFPLLSHPVYIIILLAGVAIGYMIEVHSWWGLLGIGTAYYSLSVLLIAWADRTVSRSVRRFLPVGPSIRLRRSNIDR